MSNMKRLYETVTDMYDRLGLDAEEIAAILCVSEEVVTEMVADYEQQLDATYGVH